MTLAKLERLAAAGGLPWSVCGRGFLQAIQPLMSSGVLIEERAAGGRRLRVRDLGALREFQRHLFPGAGSSRAGQGPRLEGVARFRDSKALGGLDTDMVLLRVWRDGVVHCSTGSVPARQCTERFGIFGLVLSGGQLMEPCTLEGELGLVENPAVFLGFERLRSGCVAALYGGGRISNRILDWLAGQGQCVFRHFPDYDPVGLSEFARLRERLAGRVSLHIPTDLSERFQRFSNPKLLRKVASQALLRKALESAIPEVSQVAALVAGHGGGLEQEALLL